MELHDGSASLRKGKHLNRNERIQLEGLWKAGYPPSQIAVLLGPVNTTGAYQQPVQSR